MATDETPASAEARVQAGAPALLAAWRAAAGAKLPELVEAVFADYQAFFAGGAPHDSARDYAAHHSACKAAIAHLEALLRLCRGLAPDTSGTAAPGAGEAADRRRLLREARQALAVAEAQPEEGREEER